MARPRKSTTGTATGNANLTTGKAAMEIVTLVVAGITHPGQRYDSSRMGRILLNFAWLFPPVDGWLFRSQCSKSCGGGTRRRGAVCRKSSDDDDGDDGDDESNCSQRDKLTVQTCNEFLCPQWKTGDWSEVS